jgi:signal transduction histidine kinase
LLAGIYFLAGKFGLSLAVVHPSASAIWPPSGMALAALLLWGSRLWPGIFLGAFLVNITTEGNLFTTLAIATGNTLEPLWGAWMLNRFADGPKVFERAKNTFNFVFLAALISTTVSATAGVSSLTLGGYAPWDQYAAIWLTWWLGDATGILLITPLLVIWLTQPYPMLVMDRLVEALTMLAALIFVGYVVFLVETDPGLEYLVMLPILWAAFRFGQHGVVTASFLVSGIALAGTIEGVSTFAIPGTKASLLYLQGFAGTIAVAALVLASVITERRRTEALLEGAKDELLRANEELEKRVQERTADLAEANAALLRNMQEQKRLEEQLRQAQKMESIGTLAGGIAHDFNNTLNIIRAYATLVSGRAAADAQTVEGMKIINEEVDRGAAVVRQLLTLARKTETRLARTDANQIVVTISELIKQTFPKTIDVRLRLDRSLPPIIADSNQIRQALVNICVNARDAMPGGGELNLATEAIDRKTMQRRYSEAGAGSYVCLTISDSGAGMDESVRARIFEPFFTTKRFGEGTGLGLAMVYGIMTNHHGHIEVESEPGRGTVFRLYLPALHPDEPLDFFEKPEEKPKFPEVDQAKATVLVVEDEPPMVRLLKSVLTRKGYRVLTAMDGMEAIDLYRQHGDDIDVVLMDLGLPKISGWEVIRAMEEQNPGVKIIITTGYLEPEVKPKLVVSQVKAYIHKPYTVEEVLKTLESTLA